MKNGRQRTFALLGGVFGALYLTLNNLAPSVPELVMGLLMGAAAVLLISSLLPETVMEKWRKWKHRGE